MVICDRRCKGIQQRELKEGIIPRCLVFDESESVAGGRGIAIVGLNPGQTASDEAAFLRRNATYGAWLQFWWAKRENQKENCYYTRLRTIARALKLDGPILWTEVIKCQFEKNGSKSLAETVKTCVDSFLIKELSEVPDDWPVLVAHKHAWELICGLALSKRTIIGVPHPRGWGLFPKALKYVKEDKNQPELVRRIKSHSHFRIQVNVHPLRQRDEVVLKECQEDR